MNHAWLVPRLHSSTSRQVSGQVITLSTTRNSPLTYRWPRNRAAFGRFVILPIRHVPPLWSPSVIPCICISPMNMTNQIIFIPTILFHYIDFTTKWPTNISISWTKIIPYLINVSSQCPKGWPCTLLRWEFCSNINTSIFKCILWV